MNAWDYLPNAKHIDWVLADVKRNPQKWNAAYAAAWDAAWDAARGAAWDAAWGACAALLAWDYAGDILSMEPDAVRLLASAGDHAAVLMLPAVITKHNKE